MVVRVRGGGQYSPSVADGLCFGYQHIAPCLPSLARHGCVPLRASSPTTTWTALQASNIFEEEDEDAVAENKVGDAELE